MKTFLSWFAALVALLLAGGAGYYWSQQAQQQPQRLQVPDAAAQQGEEAPAPASTPSHTIQHPIEAAPAAAQASGGAEPLPPLESADSYVANAVVNLLGRKDVQRFLALDSFVQHVVATVDSLPSRHAAARLWPVQPVGGKLQTEERDGGMFIAPANAARYEPFVNFIDGVDLRKAVALYVRLYPLFQKAYQDLGYPDKYFNDRLVAVIDHLLQTPDVNSPLKVTLPEVRGPVQPERPWLIYEFEDVSMDELSAGQRMLLRMGSGNAKRLKAKLKQLRQLVARSGMRG